MKKNVMMRIASFLLIAVLVSTSAISGTYAKYVTEATAKDTARVAAFGVQVAADFTEVFKDKYDTTDAWTDDDGVSVKSVYGGDVVAPGTNCDAVNFTVTGKPEVDVEVTYDATLTLAAWEVEGVEYCPIVFTVNGTDYSMDDGYADVATFAATVEAAIEDAKMKYNAGTDLGLNASDDLKVSWAWHFEGETEGGTGPVMQTDELDTKLGNWILNGVDAASISLEIKCTVTQID